MLGRGKNRDYSPENRPAKRPVICARKRVQLVRNAVDHVSADVMGNAEAKYHTEEAKRIMILEAEESERAAHRGKRHVVGEAASFVDHVQRLKEGEAGRMEYQTNKGVRMTTEATSPPIVSKELTASNHSIDLGATLPPSALKSTAPPAAKNNNTQITTKKGNNTGGTFDEVATTVESRPGTPSPIEEGPRHESGAPMPTPRGGGDRRMASFAFPPANEGGAADLFRSPAPLNVANLSTARGEKDEEGRGASTRARLSVAYPSATATQAKVKAAREAEELANEKAAIAYYGDIGVGLGTISRKKTVPPPKEPVLHPITGQLLPSARSASANKIFDKSRLMNEAMRDAIARGDFTVPLERQRSSIAVQRVHSSGALLGENNGEYLSHSFALSPRGRGHGDDSTSSPTRGFSPHGSFSGFIGSPTRNANKSSASLRFVSSPARNAANGRYALRAAHPSESSNTRYLFGSAAIADRENVPPPRKTTHALDDTTFDKVPTAVQTARDRRSSYAIEMVNPRYIPTNVSTLELKDVVPTHQELLERLGERPHTRRGQLAQQYNDTRGFFDPAAPLPVPGSVQRRRAASAPRCSEAANPQSQKGDLASNHNFHTERRAASRRASSVDPVAAADAFPQQQRFSLMTALEQRASIYNGNAPPLNCGKRHGDPVGLSVADTTRVLCPDRQPVVPPFRPRIAPSPVRARPCQAALVMDEVATPTRRARSVDQPRPTGIRSTFSAFVAPTMPYRPPVVSPTQQSHLWGIVGGGGGGGHDSGAVRNTIVSAVPERSSTPTGKRRVDSPARRTSICIC